MNLDNFKSFFESLIKNPQDKNIDNVLEEAINMFHGMMASLETASPKEREEMLQALAELREDLNKEFQKVSSEMGVEKEDLEEMVSNPQLYNDEVWGSLKSFRQDVEKAQKNSLKDAKKSEGKEDKKKKKDRKKWMSA